MLVLGIDPGTRITGFGLIREVSGVAELVACGTIRPKAKAPMPERLGHIFTKLAELIKEHRPAEAALEEVFTAKNPASALKLGQARGAIMAACAVNGVPVTGYAPTKIKQAVVGGGRAEKSQVSFMVGRILGKKPDWAEDAGDALAAALCHLNMRRLARLTGQ